MYRSAAKSRTRPLTPYRPFAGFRRRAAYLRHLLWELRGIFAAPGRGSETEESGDIGVVPVDCLQLAYDAFQACRCGGVGLEVSEVVNLLTGTLRQVRESGTLIVSMPDLGFRSRSSCVQVALEREPPIGRVPLSLLSPQGRKLLSYMEIAADELLRLCRAGSTVAVRSLGYAMHCIPDLIRSEEVFSPKSYEFCLRIAAYRWSDLAERFREAICDLVDVERAEVDRLASEGGFAIDMFGYSRREGVSR